MKKVLLLISLLVIIGCSSVNQRGFYTRGSKTGTHQETGTRYDRNGFDLFGFNVNGYNKEGYDSLGYNKQGYNKNGFDNQGFDNLGYNKDGYDKDGYNKEGYDKQGYNKEGYDKDGYNKEGYDNNGYNKEGWNREGVNITTGSRYNLIGFDFNGNPDFNFYKTKQSDSIPNIKKEISKVLNTKEVKKIDFETTKEFEVRKAKILEQYPSEIEKFRKKVFVYNFEDTDNFTSKYNADTQNWRISFNYIIDLVKKSNNDSYTASNAFGSKVEVKEYNSYYESIIFSNSDNSNYYKKEFITINIPMELNKAKEFKGFKLQLLYKSIANLEKASYSDFSHIEPTFDAPYEFLISKNSLFSKFVGAIVWDNEMNEVLHFEKAK